MSRKFKKMPQPYEKKEDVMDTAEIIYVDFDGLDELLNPTGVTEPAPNYDYPEGFDEATGWEDL